MFITHCVSTINEAYKNYYQRGIKCIEIDVSLTQDNKVVLSHEDLKKQRLKKMKNINRECITLEEFCKHTPEDLKVFVDIKRYDDRDWVYRVTKFCEQQKKKEQYVYITCDKRFAKQIQCMRRFSALICMNLEDLDPYYDNIVIPRSLLIDFDKVKTARHSNIEKPEWNAIYVFGVKSEEYDELKLSYPLVSGWICSVV